ncbi:MAG: hypothetical protein GY757_05480 [bacterium]|nr:hypothetical protein [bacterium]
MQFGHITYKNLRDLKKESEFIFKNRDLLILDWELSKGGIKFANALHILKEAVESPNLAFVIIYTHEADLDGIEMQIRSFFNQKAESNTVREQRYEQLLARLDDEFFFVEEDHGVPDKAEAFFGDRKIKEILKEFVLTGPSDKALKKFKADIRQCFSTPKIGKEFLDLFEQSLKELYMCNDLFKGCEQIQFLYNNTYIARKTYSSLPNCEKICEQAHALWVNNTYITIFDKRRDSTSPDAVYTCFANQLCSKPGNILTLIALEMKNNFRENSGKVGKGLLAIDELAFFYHQANLGDNEEFYDFLRNNWKHQVASFHLGTDSNVFPVMEEYVKKNRIAEGVKLAKQKPGFLEELAKLNFQYSFHHSDRKDSDYLRFGDIFSFRESMEDGIIESFLLNITPHCDCLRPEKINYNFHFVAGVEKEQKHALLNATSEKEYFSFLFRNDNSLCISWITKPFTIFIPEEKGRISAIKIIKVKIEDKVKYLVYEGSLLENYTQRIANKSFAQASRVGVDLAEYRK